MKIRKVMNWSRLALVVMCLFMFGMVAFGAEAATNAAPAEAIAEAVQNPSATTDTGMKYLSIAAIMACGSYHGVRQLRRRAGSRKNRRRRHGGRC